jgi:hypothetical protein
MIIVKNILRSENPNWEAMLVPLVMTGNDEGEKRSRFLCFNGINVEVVFIMFSIFLSDLQIRTHLNLIMTLLGTIIFTY